MSKSSTDKLYPKVLLHHLCAISPYGDPFDLERFLPHLNEAMNEFGINTRLRQSHFLAQIAYESEDFAKTEGGDFYSEEDLGNVYPGDEEIFAPRGLIKFSGRTAYEELSEVLDENLLVHPQRLADEDVASRSAGWFWQREELNYSADSNDFDGIVKTLNHLDGGYGERRKKLNEAKKVFNIQ
ncbi:putative chitinase [Leptolyngbyaceae cyanobacterium JSC-12]|nr:putative chitinase [Leptolyngbyaceae cyanobacterium JSC-12]